MAGSLGRSLKTGDRIRLISMPEDPDPVPVGTLVVVLRVIDYREWQQVEVAWDNGRKLMLSLPEDCIELLPRG
jgi:hypothetical protein